MFSTYYVWNLSQPFRYSCLYGSIGLVMYPASGSVPFLTLYPDKAAISFPGPDPDAMPALNRTWIIRYGVMFG